MGAVGDDPLDRVAQAFLDQGAGLSPARHRAGVVQQTGHGMGLVLDLVEAALAGIEQGLDLVDRGQVAFGMFGLVQIGRQRLAVVGQHPNFLVDDVDEAVAPLVRQVAVFDQDVGGRTDHGHAVQHLVDFLAQERVVRQPVRQNLGAHRRLAFRTGQGRDAAGPSGEAADQLARSVGLDVGAFQRRQVGDLDQFGTQAFLGDTAQIVQGQVQCLGDLAQQRAGDRPFVPFDQIEVAGRDSDLAGKRRLGHPHVAPVLPDTGPRDVANHLEILFFPPFPARVQSMIYYAVAK